MRKDSLITTLVIIVAIIIGGGLVYGFITYDQQNNTTNSVSGGETSEDDDNVINVPDEADSLQEAVDRASDGDIILLAEGTFDDTSESGGITTAVAVDKAVTIEGAGRGKTIIDGKSKAMHGIYILDSVSGKVVVKGLTIQGFTNNGLEILAKETEVSEVTVKDNGNRGVSYRNVGAGSSLHNSIVVSNRFNGVYSEKSAVKIYNNTIVDNGPSGITIVVTDTDAEGTSPEIYNNIISGHTANGIFYDHPAFPKVVVVDHNNLFGNKAAYFEELNNEGTKTRAIQPTPGDGELKVDPDFVDEESFELPEASDLLTASRDGAELGAYGK